ncbi:MAG: hypothetical protein Q4F95_08160 [Oscillospiraceae bacterium]|nr:hypothetical protein [Oscillospiraceae bacterium]
MKKVLDLNLGFSDAQTYLQRSNKQMFSEIFVKNYYLEDLLKPNIYFLIGEKGTGKTAYATYLTNNEYKQNKSFLKFICGTDYEKFYELKRTGKIDISGYADIWQCIILLITAKSIANDNKLVESFSRSRITDLLKAIDEYYNKAFSPEIINALKIVDQSGYAATLISKHAEVGAKQDNTTEFTEQKMQMNLYYISQQFSSCLNKIKLNKNINIFIDGIDVRPSQIPFDEYLNCIKGLLTSCWILNTELFANTKDSKGKIKIILLLRPDIYNALNVQNSTNKLLDNSVYLEWRTTYSDYYSSALYQMAQKLLSYDQPDICTTDIWEKYFNWNTYLRNGRTSSNNAFKEFLKISLSRPRDIQIILKLLQVNMKQKGNHNDSTFDYHTYISDKFQNDYSEYFLSSLKDQLSFYYSEDDYQYFKKFFDFFTGPQFSFTKYQEAYNQYADYILEHATNIPPYIEKPESFLQFLYDSNVVAAVEENGRFFHFSYREKSPTNISPEVPYDINMNYKFHYGLYKKTRLGRY